MIDKIISLIEQNDKIAIFHHKRPDGDSISSSYGLLLALQKKYPNKKIVYLADEEYLGKYFSWFDFDKSSFVTEIDNSYLTIIGDVSIIDRIQYSDEFKKGKNKIIFDHHKNEKDSEVDIFWHEPEYPAAAMQATEIAFALDFKMNEEIAFALALGLLTDTGNFMYSLANAKIVKLYAQLLEYISNEKMSELFNNFKRKTKEDIEMTSWLLNNLQFKGKVSYVIIPKEMTEKYDRMSFKFKVNTIGNIEGYPIWAQFTYAEDQEKCLYEVGLRSNGPHVNEVAKKHNGGGHNRASGCKAKNEKEVKKILKDLNNLVK